jgi:aldose 1-epimerase
MAELLTLAQGDLRLVLTPAIGGSVFAFTRGGMPIFRPSLPGALDQNEPRSMGCYPLFPFSNRVANRRFSFAGQSYELPDLLNGFAIHGAGWKLPWHASLNGDTARLVLDYTPSPLWPFAFRAEQSFTLQPDALVCDLSIQNWHTAPAPAGFGLHPFFPRSPATRLQFSASHVWHNDASDMIPIERTKVPVAWDHRDGRPVGEIALDNCFAGWAHLARLHYPDRGYTLSISADAVFRHLVVFTPPGQDFLAVEPASNMNDGLNRMDGTTDHGVFVLAPGETRSGRITFRIDTA